MTNQKRHELLTWLHEMASPGNEPQVRNIVLLLTLVLEVVSQDLLYKLHEQNMARAEHGRHSEKAEAAGKHLAEYLKQHLARHVRLNGFGPSPAESMKAEFIAVNPTQTWSQTPPSEKAAEELKELIHALTMEQYSERVLDALIDVVYAGTEVAGVHY